MDKKAQLINILNSRALISNQETKLASGASSGTYINCKKLSLHGPSLKLLGEMFIDKIIDDKSDLIGGVCVGGDPLVAACILEANKRNWEVEGLLVRKDPKTHGASQGECIESGSLKEFSNRPNVWLIEDVVTTGKSSYLAAENLRKDGYDLKGIYVIVDRQSGGMSFLRQKLKCPVKSLCKLSDLG